MKATRACRPADTTVKTATVEACKVDLTTSAEEEIPFATFGRLFDPMEEEAVLQVSFPMIESQAMSQRFPVDADPVAISCGDGGIRGFLGTFLEDEVILFAGTGDGGPSRAKVALAELAPAGGLDGLGATDEGLVSSSAPVANSSPDLVSVGLDHIVGPLEVPEAQPADALEAFVKSIQLPLPEPLISTTPKLRETKTRKKIEADHSLVPKRSARLAAKSGFRAAKPEAQARKVIMKKLGIEVETEQLDQASFEEFQQTFVLPLSVSKDEAMRELFPGRNSRRLDVECSA